MGRLGGFIRGMFGGPAKDEPPPTGDLLLRAYGKLPFFPEYRRLEITPGAPTVYSQWMDAGRLAWCRSPTKSEHGVTRPSRIVLRLPECKEVVVASVWDSRDSAGRVFPFSFFVVCLPELLGNDSTEQWVAARGLHLSFDKAYAELSGFSAGGDFYRLYSRRYLPPRPADLLEQVAGLRQEAAAMPSLDWFRAWAPDGKLDPTVWFANLEKNAAGWRAGESAANLAVSCPLASGYSYPAQTICWLTLLSGVAGRSGKPLTFIGPGTESPEGASLHFVIRDPKPDDFQLLSSDAGRYGFVENLATVPAPSASIEPATATTAEPGVPLLEWMYRNAAGPVAATARSA